MQGPAALTVPNPLAALQPGPRDLYQLPDRSDRFQRLTPHPVPQYPGYPGYPGPYLPGSYYGPYAPYYPNFTGPYGYPSFAAASEYQLAPRRVLMPTGGLALETLPDAAQVYVDGFYVGLVEEFGLRGRPLDLTTGAHHVEVRAPGYQTLTFSVMITANDVVRYRGNMQSLDALTATAAGSPRTSPQPAAPKSFYVIPNCYAGDKPPSANLPSGCDRTKLQTRKI
jgi:hypothetical protein